MRPLVRICNVCRFSQARMRTERGIRVGILVCHAEWSILTPVGQTGHGKTVKDEPGTILADRIEAMSDPRVIADPTNHEGRTMSAVEDAVGAKPKLIRQPWKYAGIPKSTWYRLAAEKLTPKPVSLPGSGRLYRIEDLDRWVAKLKTA